MKVSELKRIIGKLPDDMEIEIFNGDCEWYGLRPIAHESLKRMDDKLVLNFGGEWDEYDVAAFRETRRKSKGAA